MIWTMIVYFFAVIGVVALLYCIIGWWFTHADAGGHANGDRSKMFMKETEETVDLKCFQLRKLIDETEPIQKQTENEIAWQEHCKSHNLKG